MNKTLEAIDVILLELHQRIQDGRCLTSEAQSKMMLKFLHEIANKDEPISKAEACGYVHVSRATFDRLVKEGRLPKGKKRKGWTELVWYEKDLDKYVDRLV
jgi:predicted DNA-binding transcriptional regulator AlpA